MQFKRATKKAESVPATLSVQAGPWVYEGFQTALAVLRESGYKVNQSDLVLMACIEFLGYSPELAMAVSSDGETPTPCAFRYTEPKEGQKRSAGRVKRLNQIQHVLFLEERRDSLDGVMEHLIGGLSEKQVETLELQRIANMEAAEAKEKAEEAARQAEEDVETEDYTDPTETVQELRARLAALEAGESTDDEAIVEKELEAMAEDIIAEDDE